MPDNHPEPMLGCARTEELLEELACRLEDQASKQLQQLAWLCRAAILWAPPGILEYRTVDNA